MRWDQTLKAEKQGKNHTNTHLHSENARQDEWRAGLKCGACGGQHCLGRVIGHSRRGEKQGLSTSPEPAGDPGRGSGPTLKHGLCRFRTSAEQPGRRFTAAEAPALHWELGAGARARQP